MGCKPTGRRHNAQHQQEQQRPEIEKQQGDVQSSASKQTKSKDRESETFPPPEKGYAKRVGKCELEHGTLEVFVRFVPFSATSPRTQVPSSSNAAEAKPDERPPPPPPPTELPDFNVQPPPGPPPSDDTANDPSKVPSPTPPPKARPPTKSGSGPQQIQQMPKLVDDGFFCWFSCRGTKLRVTRSPKDFRKLLRLRPSPAYFPEAEHKEFNPEWCSVFLVCCHVRAVDLKSKMKVFAGWPFVVSPLLPILNPQYRIMSKRNTACSHELAPIVMMLNHPVEVVSVHACMYICSYMCIHTCTGLIMCIYIYIYICMYVCMYND